MRDAAGACHRCDRRAGKNYYALPDGRYTTAGQPWRDEYGREVSHPSAASLTRADWRKTILAIARLDGRPSNARAENLLVLCQHCLARHEDKHGRAKRRREPEPDPDPIEEPEE